MFDKGVYIGIDIGGSWIKATFMEVDYSIKREAVPELVKRSKPVKVASGLGESSSVFDFIAALDTLFGQLKPNQKVLGIGVSTAGVVDYKGESVILAANHLSALKDPRWRDHLLKRFDAPVTLINDANATAIGAVAAGYLHGLRTIGIMPIGTGVGFTIWRNGRRWEPNHMLPLLGCIGTPAGSFDQIAGVSALASRVNNDLSSIFTDASFNHIKERYIEDLSKVIYTSCVLYHTDAILVGGGLADALKAERKNVEQQLEEKTNNALAALGKKVEVKIMPEGNTLPLIGSVLLAMGERVAHRAKSGKSYKRISTETPYDQSLPLHRLNAQVIVQKLYNAEEESGARLSAALPEISDVAEKVAEKLRNGGRLIYVGAGTSGRLAAIDTVELACTFGFPRDKVYTLISGGLADAAMEIETNFEEDASAIPELLLTALTENDVIIGITVSGYAHYVLSALAFAKDVGAYSVLIQEQPDTGFSLCDKVIALYSGQELIAGSTRMKAGTATKKVLNFLSTTAMILLGKVYGPYMIEMECINHKLINRAQHILYNLFGINEDEAYATLKANGFNLKSTIKELSDEHLNMKPLE